jgi:hypothetical protein
MPANLKYIGKIGFQLENQVERNLDEVVVPDLNLFVTGIPAERLRSLKMDGAVRQTPAIRKVELGVGQIDAKPRVILGNR